jgi:hypothetical protein
MRWARHVALIGDMRSTFRVQVGRTEGMRPLGSPRLRWEDNIKSFEKWDGMDWIELAQDKDR